MVAVEAARVLCKKRYHACAASLNDIPCSFADVLTTGQDKSVVMGGTGVWEVWRGEGGLGVFHAKVLHQRWPPQLLPDLQGCQQPVWGDSTHPGGARLSHIQRTLSHVLLNMRPSLMTALWFPVFGSHISLSDTCSVVPVFC